MRFFDLARVFLCMSTNLEGFWVLQVRCFWFSESVYHVPLGINKSNRFVFVYKR